VPADDPSVDGEPAPETALESRLGEATKTARRPAGWLGS
jgi:hypothetical protein